eukprot:3830861-Rhodomonas_salina.1
MLDSKEVKPPERELTTTMLFASVLELRVRTRCADVRMAWVGEQVLARAMKDESEHLQLMFSNYFLQMKL